MICLSIPSEEVLLNALNHQIRRDILELLKNENKTYSQILNNFVIPTGKLNYHLRLLEGLIKKDQDGLYGLTELGSKAVNILHRFRTELTDTEKPLIRQAYISQKNEEESFLHLVFVSRMNFKFTILILTGFFICVLGIYYISIGGTFIYVFFSLGLGLVIMSGGIIWIIKIKKAAPEFINQFDKLLKQTKGDEK